MKTFLILLVLILAFSTALLCMSLRRRLRERERMAQTFRKEKQSLREDLDRERRCLLDCLVDEVLFFDDKERLLYYNSSVESLFQGRRLEGVMVNELLYESSVTQGIRECLHSGKPYSTELPLGDLTNIMGVSLERRDSVCRIEVSQAQLADAGLTVCVILRDVTADAEADQVRRDFVANASHELRTPMAIVGGYIENLLEDEVLEDPVMARKFIGIMQKHSQRISQIIEDMLSISQLESARDSMNSAPFFFRECVEDVAERLSALIIEHGVTLTIEVEPDDLEIIGDRFYWTQILFNLIENAIKQNQKKDDLQVITKACEQGGEFVISVSDNGKGIPANDVPFVFKRFYRVDKHHTNSEIKGTGLGLSIVRRAVEAHGGTITLTSVPGVETNFTIKLPFP